MKKLGRPKVPDELKRKALQVSFRSSTLAILDAKAKEWGVNRSRAIERIFMSMTDEEIARMLLLDMWGR